MVQMGATILSKTSKVTLTEIVSYAKQPAVLEGKAFRELHEKKVKQLRGEPRNRTSNIQVD